MLFLKVQWKSLRVFSSCWWLLLILGISWLHHSNLCLHCPIAFFSVSLVSLCPSLPLFSLIKTEVTGWGPTLIQYEHILTLFNSITSCKDLISKYGHIYKHWELELEHNFLRIQFDPPTVWPPNPYLFHGQTAFMTSWHPPKLTYFIINSKSKLSKSDIGKTHPEENFLLICGDEKLVMNYLFPKYNVQALDRHYHFRRQNWKEKGVTSQVSSKLNKAISVRFPGPRTILYGSMLSLLNPQQWYPCSLGLLRWNSNRKALTLNIPLNQVISDLKC